MRITADDLIAIEEAIGRDARACVAVDPLMDDICLRVTCRACGQEMGSNIRISKYEDDDRYKDAILRRVIQQTNEYITNLAFAKRRPR